MVERQFSNASKAELLAQIKAGKIKGIAENLKVIILEIANTGESSFANELRESFDESFLEILKIKGLGVKKVNALKKELAVNSIEDLETACKSDKLIELKGFAKKTQSSILQNIAFYKTTRGLFHYRTGRDYLELVENKLKNNKHCLDLEIDGEYRKNEQVIDGLEILIETDDSLEILKSLEDLPEAKEIKSDKEQISITFKNKLPLKIDFVKKEKIQERRKYFEKNFSFPGTVNASDIKGIIHAHSSYSDGIHSLKSLAVAVKEKGYQYLGISDHSQSAFYASGLKMSDIRRQHAEIDKLNQELAPFVIFKGIESDILKDGSLDYPDNILESFDFIIASVHSNFEMQEEEMTKRIVRAIQNPYTTILGHPTGRLLLKRPGYQIDMDQVLETAAKYNVAIEINSNPLRLDLDWSFHKKAVDLGILLPISPDAHSIEQIDYVEYGVAVAKKGGVKKEDVLTAWDVDEVKEYFGLAE